MCEMLLFGYVSVERERALVLDYCTSFFFSFFVLVLPIFPFPFMCASCFNLIWFNNLIILSRHSWCHIHHLCWHCFDQHEILFRSTLPLEKPKKKLLFPIIYFFPFKFSTFCLPPFVCYCCLMLKTITFGYFHCTHKLSVGISIVCVRVAAFYC